MDMPVNVPVDDPNADTEWNDILRKHGVIPEKPPSPTPMIEEAISEARRLAHEHRLEGKDLDELDELEDDEDEEFLNRYRRTRFNELSQIQKASIFNQVFFIQKPDYATDVTEASKNALVLVLLISSTGTNVESQLMAEIWRELAARFGEIKFCQMRADLCIEGYPDRNTPTVLCYKGGEIQRQIVTLKELNGAKTSANDIEKILLQLGAIKHGDARLSSKVQGSSDDPDGRKPAGSAIRSSMRPDRSEEDGDSDWD